jgi:hypothetical protein
VRVVLREEFMKASSLVAAVLAVLLADASARAQAPYAKPVRELTSDGPGAAEAAPGTFAVSRWLTPNGYGCYSETDGPPIGAEVYLSGGWSIPLSTTISGKERLGRDMSTGYVVQGGLRTSFFNMPADRAWVVDISLSHMNNGHNQQAKYPLRVLEFTGNTDPLTGQPEVKRIQFGTPTRPGVTIRDTGRTFVNLGLGRDYYVWGTAETDERHLRVGWDVGARYGTLSQEYHEIKHRTDVIGGTYVGVHGEYEIPTRMGMLTFGARTEWGYTWSDILQQASDIQEINVLLTLGLRY